MKNEEFDDAVRKKLESIHHLSSDTDIEKVFQHVKKNRRLPFRGIKGSWLFYSLSAAAMVTFTTVMISRLNENKHTVKQSVEKSIDHKTDNAKDTINEETLVNSNSNNSDVLGALQPNTNPAKPIIMNQGVINTKKDSDYLPPKSEPAQTYSGNMPVTSVMKQPEPSTIVESDTSGMTGIIANSNPDKRIYPEPGSRPALSSTDSINISPKSENVTVPAPLDISQSFNPEPPSIPVYSDSAITSFPSGIKNSNSLLTGTTISAGASFRFSGQRIGMGVAGELKFGKHIGFTTGLTYNFLKAEQFQDKQDLNGHKHGDFNHHIHDHLNDKEHVTNITIKSQLLQLPLSVNYSIPLKQNFSVRISFGTDLDLYLKQKLMYEDHVDSTHFHERQLDTKGDVEVFNNLFFGIVVGKCWNHFVLSIEPYYSQGLKQVYYKPEETEFGIGVSLKYSF